MSSFQRVIKYIGIALAIVLMIGIIGGAFTIIFGVKSFSKNENDTSMSSASEEYEFDESKNGKETTVSATSKVYEFDEFTSMDISSGVADVEVMFGDGYRVETKDVPETIEVEVRSNGKLVVKVKDENAGFLDWMDGSKWNKNSKITIIVPDGYKASEISISGGVGKVSINDLSMEKLTVDGGVGDIKGKNIVVDKVDVDAGVGNIEFDSVEFGTCTIDSGVGNVTVSGVISGDSEFSGGVGNMDLDIEGSRDDYSLSIDGGIGTVRVNGQKIQDLKENHSGKKELEVDGGLGSISINFTQD